MAIARNTERRSGEPRMLGDILREMFLGEPWLSNARRAGYDVVEYEDGTWGIVEAPKQAS